MGLSDWVVDSNPNIKILGPGDPDQMEPGDGVVFRNNANYRRLFGAMRNEGGERL